MKICLLALWGDSLTYTIASALAYRGHEVGVKIADVERDCQSRWSLSRRIGAIPGVSFLGPGSSEPREGFAHLIVQGHPLLLKYRDLPNELAAGVQRVTAVSAGDRSRPRSLAMKIQLGECRWYGRWLRKVGRVAYKDGFYPVDLMGLFGSRRVVGFDAHSKFLGDRSLFDVLHARDWESETPRSVRANFLGSRDPQARSRILGSVEDFFLKSDGACTRAAAGQRMVWHVYSDAQPAALGPEGFLGVLSDSDFTLAPLGYSLVTHRPVEALLRGSIPVLDAAELDLYDLGLVDGVNCIAVQKGGWRAAMQRIVTMSEDQIVAMRRSIQSMLAERVDYPALARDISRRLGIDGLART
jgi:hypothetical protein